MLEWCQVHLGWIARKKYYRLTSWTSRRSPHSRARKVKFKSPLGLWIGSDEGRFPASPEIALLLGSYMAEKVKFGGMLALEVDLCSFLKTSKPSRKLQALNFLMPIIRAPQNPHILGIRDLSKNKQTLSKHWVHQIMSKMIPFKISDVAHHFMLASVINVCH